MLCVCVLYGCNKHTDDIISRMWAANVFILVVCSLLMGVCVGGDPKGLHLAVVNDDFRCGDGLPALPKDCDVENMRGLSCRYLDALDKDVFILVSKRHSSYTGLLPV